VTIKIVSLTRSSAVTDRTAQCAVLLNIFAVTLSVNSSDKRNLTLRRIIALERFLMLVGAKVLYCGTIPASLLETTGKLFFIIRLRRYTSLIFLKVNCRLHLHEAQIMFSLYVMSLYKLTYCVYRGVHRFSRTIN